MRKRKKKPRYSAKPGQLETAQAKDYTAPKNCNGPFIENAAACEINEDLAEKSRYFFKKFPDVPAHLRNDIFY